jgi:hypothetical protein
MKTGKVISRYGSISTAAKAVNVHKTGISKCCRGLYRCSAGFGWRYASVGIPEEVSKRVSIMIINYYLTLSYDFCTKYFRNLTMLRLPKIGRNRKISSLSL